MRLHPRRTFLLFCTFFLFVILAVYTYNKNISFDRKKKSIFALTPRKLISKGNGKHIYWTKDSGVKKNLYSNNSSRKSHNDEDKVDDHDDEKQLKRINFNMNILASNLLPLNRDVPDSRPIGCAKLTYPEQLPATSVVIPFHNEWPSVLMRTVHSLVNRTPRHLLKKIILVDDASELNILKKRLGNYVKWTFPEDLVKIVRLSSRQGLIRARLEGFKHVTSETVSFFDSHMEVNKNWLQPLLYEIKKNRKTVAMTQLDYIDSSNFNYNFFENYRTRYGFKWDMEFFETFFRPDQLMGKTETDPLPGVLMVGPGFVVDTQYFKDLGTYDDAMKIWGGENIEFAWRTWMCGGKMLHVPCSRVGHIERSQPYSFPEGRIETEMFNYKRAIEVWMGPYKEYVYYAIPGIKDIEVGNLTERLRIKERLHCKDFSWFHKHIWPELLPYKHVGEHWGQVKSLSSDNCLDNDGFLFQDPQPLYLKACSKDILKQGFALSTGGELRTTLHCVVVRPEGEDLVPFIENCFLNTRTKWSYDKNGRIVHTDSRECLQVMVGKKLVLQPCLLKLDAQKWSFKHDLWLSESNNA